MQKWSQNPVFQRLALSSGVGVMSDVTVQCLYTHLGTWCFCLGTDHWGKSWQSHVVSHHTFHVAWPGMYGMLAIIGPSFDWRPMPCWWLGTVIDLEWMSLSVSLLFSARQSSYWWHWKITHKKKYFILKSMIMDAETISRTLDTNSVITWLNTESHKIL
jgi:hypothetical protein